MILPTESSHFRLNSPKGETSQKGKLPKGSTSSTQEVPQI